MENLQYVFGYNEQESVDFEKSNTQLKKTAQNFKVIERFS